MSISELQFAQSRTPSFPDEASKMAKFERAKVKMTAVYKIPAAIWVKGIIPYIEIGQIDRFFRIGTQWRAMSNDASLYKNICLQQGIVVQGDRYLEAMKQFAKLSFCLKSPFQLCSEFSPIVKTLASNASMVFFEPFFNKMASLDSSGKLQEWRHPQPMKLANTFHTKGIERGITVGKRVIFSKGKTVECFDFNKSSDQAEATFTLHEDGVQALAFHDPHLAISTANHFYLGDVKKGVLIKAWNDAHSFRHLHFVNGGIATLSYKGNLRFVALDDLKMKFGHPVPNLSKATAVHMISNRIIAGFENGSMEVWEWMAKGVIKLGTLQSHKAAIVDITHCSHMIIGAVDCTARMTIWNLANYEKPVKEFSQQDQNGQNGIDRPNFIRFNLTEQQISTLSRNNDGEWVLRMSYYNTPSGAGSGLS